MTGETAIAIWSALRDRFSKMAEELTEEQLDCGIGESTVRKLLYHTAEVEYLFADWYLGKPAPEKMPAAHTKAELTAFLAASDEHLRQAVSELSEEQWQTSVESKMGSATPLETVGRLMYHAGIHARQIALMKKQQA